MILKTIPLLALCAAIPAFAQDPQPVSMDALVQQLAQNPGADLYFDTKTTSDPVTITLSSKTSGWTTSADPTAFFQAVRAAIPATTIKADYYTYTSQYGKLTVQGQDLPIYDLAKDVTGNLATPDETDANSGTFVDNKYRTLSIVGSIVSYETSGSSFGPGAAHPNMYADITTVDVSTLQTQSGSTQFAPVNLRDLVDEASLLSALKADPFIRGSVKTSANVAKLKATADVQQFANVLNDIWQNMGSCYLFPLFQGETSSFAINDYNVATKMMNVRLEIMPSSVPCDSEQLTTLGLNVKPDSEFIYKLESTVKNGGLFMKNAK